MLQLVVPAFLQTNDYLDLLHEPRLKGIDMLLARGRHESMGIASLEALVCNELNIARQQDFPVAPISVDAAGVSAGNHYWLRADPVHARIERDQVILNALADPTEAEAAMLCDALSAHFGEAFSPQPLQPNVWVFKCEMIPAMSTTPLSSAIGKDMDAHLPGGSDAMQWRKLLNEVQMLLFHHPVNQAREQRGEPAINSVWFWGGGCLPNPGNKCFLTLYTEHSDWRALARFAGAEVRTMPAQYAPDIPEDSLIILDEPQRLLLQGDLQNWLRAMEKFEAEWIQPLIGSGRHFRIHDPLQGTSLYWRSAYRWKFWRQAPKPAQRPIRIQPPPGDSGVDAFGNRY